MTNNSPPTIDRKITRVEIIIILCASILLTYYQIFSFDFLTYDTLVYVTKNTIVHAGINIDNIRWAFTTNFFSNWHPLTWISYMIDMELWGLNPAGFHATNLFFHTCNTLLLFYILQKTTNKVQESTFVAGLFALHPMHVESVVWVAERKDVLSTFFFLLTIVSYLRYLKNQSLFKYLLSLLVFSLALMSKSMVVTLPAILLLLDYWPLKRFGICSCHPTKIGEKTNDYKSIILEKIPFFILSAIVSHLTLLAQHSNLTTLEGLPLATRLASVPTSYIAYIEKTLWPIKLAVLYPHHGMPSLPKLLFAFLVLFGITLLGMQWRKTRPWFIVGWLWFLGTLVPVLGIVHVGHHFIADRYTYIPHIGAFIMISWGISEICTRLHSKHNLFLVIVCGVLLISGIRSWHQIQYWKNDRTLWTRTLDITHINYIAENNLGTALLNSNFQAESQNHFLNAIRINGQYTEAYSNLALAQALQGQLDDSINNYLIAISMNPDNFQYQYRVAQTYKANNMPEKAIIHFLYALKLQPQHMNTRIRLGELFFITGQFKKALEIYKSIAKDFPEDTDIQKKIMNIEETIINNHEKEPDNANRER